MQQQPFFGDDVPSDTPRVLGLYFEAIDMLLLGVHLSYRRMQEAALRVAELAEREDTPNWQGRLPAAEIGADVTALVNTINRLRLLIRHLPGDETTRLAKRAFEAAVRHVEPVRHYLEHLEDSVHDIAKTGFSFYGRIAWWWRPDDERMVLTGILSPRPGPRRPIPSARVPSLMRGRIDHFLVTIGDKTFDLSDAYFSAARLETRLRDWSREQQNTGWPAIRSWKPG